MRTGKPLPPQNPAAVVGRFLFLGGLFVPLFATFLVTIQSSLPLPKGLWEAQRTTPWLWLLDLLPIVLAFYGRFLSLPPSHSNRGVPLLLAILTLLFSVPCSAMLYARQQAQLSIQSQRTMRLAGQLEMLALRVYISHSQKSYGDIRPQLAQMSELRKAILPVSPAAIKVTERPWEDFYQAALKRNLSLDNALRLRDGIAKLTRALETDAQHSNNEAAQLLLSGMLGTLVLMGLAIQLFYQLQQTEQQLGLANQKQLKTSQQLEAANLKLQEANERVATVNGKLESSSTHDTLTKLLNRRALDEQLASEWTRALRYSQPLTVMMLDIDYFKSYNESFGRPAGDAVLETVGTLLLHAVRATDFVARYGGEEFIVVMPHTHEDEAVRIAERLRAGIQVAPWKNRGVTVSIGVAEKTMTMTRVAELTTAADIALFQAKKTRDRVCASQDLPTAQHNKAA